MIQSQRLLMAPLFLLLVFICCPVVAQGSKPHIVLVVGTTHYSPELTMPLLAQELERFGFRTTVVMGKGNPETKTENVLPGIEALETADAAIFFMRFLKLPDQEWSYLENYFTSGKPVIALRTTSHSFKYAMNHPRWKWNDDFGSRVMGTPYVVHQSGTTKINIVDKNKSHPILANVNDTDWVSQGTLYLTRLRSGCIPLVIGTGRGRPRLIEKRFGPVSVNESESDIVAWTWENEWGGKVFGTSFGHPADFSHAGFTRMLLNSVHWAVGKPTPSSDTKISTWEIQRADKTKQQKSKQKRG